MVKIKTKDIFPSKYNLRSKVTNKSIIELANSMKKSKGNIVPIRVRKRKEGGYEIVYGYRRWYAASIEGIEELDCEIVDIDDEELLKQSILENLQREPLLEEDRAKAIKILINQFEYNALAIAKLCGKKSEVWTYHQLNILKFPEKMKEMLKGVPHQEIKKIPMRLHEIPQAMSTKLFSIPNKRLKTSTAVIICQRIKEPKKATELANIVMNRGITQKRTIKLLDDYDKLEKGEDIDEFFLLSLSEKATFKDKIIHLLNFESLNYNVKGQQYQKLWDLQIKNKNISLEWIVKVALDIGFFFFKDYPNYTKLDPEDMGLYDKNGDFKKLFKGLD